MAKKLYYKIGEACKILDIQPYVLRYWETEFTSLSPSKSKSGQRTYTEKDLEVIGRIKELLYEEGFTIAGAKKRLEGELDGGGLKPLRPLDLSGKSPPKEAVTAKPEKTPAKPSKTAGAKKARKPKKKEAVPSSESGEVDTEKIQQLEAGIGAALSQAQAILALLDTGTKKR